ncbi:apoptosis facilitator Bcl-2-like protein 14 [Carlito syrichta]|uniref:Apoptosis facilitator Bcl-2-like protein 14 n=1 Tax=Carlito syrichta TaxID=1868482 RepID=A0A1U7TTE1_CARSF|nr:apoptosis facilitator Bcl-2-like protein 14 [Carlito syrichta]
MYSTSKCDLEEVPLDDDDPNSIEFKILAYYTRHHIFKGPQAVSSPKPLRARSWSQKGLGSWTTNESWTQVSWPCRSSQSSEKPINLAKKKSSWKAFFGVVEKEEDVQSSPPEALSPRTAEFLVPYCQLGSQTQSDEEQFLEQQAVDPKVVSIANRVAEIVYSWPPLEETQAGVCKPKESFVPLVPGLQLEGLSIPSSSKKDEEDQIIAKIVELLKYSGDQMERELKKDKALMSCFQDGLPYSMFKTIIDQSLRGVDTRGESEVKAQGFKAALAIDVTAKLTAIDNHPMNRVLGFGAKYLKENFSPWIQQHGGWEKILGISHEEVD